MLIRQSTFTGPCWPEGVGARRPIASAHLVVEATWVSSRTASASSWRSAAPPTGRVGVALLYQRVGHAGEPEKGHQRQHQQQRHRRSGRQQQLPTQAPCKATQQLDEAFHSCLSTNDDMLRSADAGRYSPGPRAAQGTAPPMAAHAGMCGCGHVHMLHRSPFLAPPLPP